MSYIRYLAVFPIFFSGCATPQIAAKASMAPENVAAVVPKIMIQMPEDWAKTNALSDGKDVVGLEFTHSRTKATVFFRILLSDGQTADQMAAHEAWLHGVSGREVYNIERAINGRTLATAMWRGTKAERSMNGTFGVRGLKEHPDFLLVVNAKWPKGTPKEVLDEIDLMILLATIE